MLGKGGEKMGNEYRFLDVPVSDAASYVKDKERSTREFATYFLIRLMKMFKYDGLPEEIPEDCLNKMLLERGYCWFTKWHGVDNVNKTVDQFFVFQGRFSEIQDAYYRPRAFLVSNPGANCYETFYLNRQKGGTYYGDEGVIIRNDTMYHGLMPLIKRYSYLLAENILTMHTADVFLRILALISGQDDKTLASANNFIKGIEEGKMMAVGESKFFEGVKMQSPPSNNGSYLTQFIEYQQYFLGSFFNEIGLNANFNMKRESIAKSESSLNEDSMLPLCQNMLMCRQQDFDVVNEMFGLNIKVSFDSAWLQNALEIMATLETLKSSMQIGGGKNDETAEENYGAEESDGESMGDAGGESGSDGNSEESGNEAEEDGGKTEEDTGEVTEAEKDVDELILQASGLNGAIQIEEDGKTEDGKTDTVDEKKGEEEDESNES